MKNTVPQMFLQTVEKHPRAVAIVEEENRIDYKTLSSMVSGMVSFLASLDVGKGDKVAILLPNSTEFIVGFLATLSLGGIAVPLNPAYKERELEFYIKHCGVKALLTEEKLKPLGEKILSGDKASTTIAIVRGGNKDWTPQGGKHKLPEVQINPHDEAIYLYSTGSTGKPKRVARTHFNLSALAHNHSDTINLTYRDKLLLVVPISHTYGFGNFIGAIKAGGEIYLLEKFNRNKVIELIESESITIFPCVPSMLDILADTFLPEPRNLSSLRLLISAGAPLSKETFFKFYKKFGVYPRQLYGSTETGAISINLSGDIENTYNSVGVPLKNVEVKIFRGEGGIADTDEVGEIAVKSPSMTTGYYGLEEETKKSFRDGYYFTGDLGRIDGKGRIYITGRKKLFINVGGNKVDPVEIENFLATYPKIKEAVVVGIQEGQSGEVVKAFIVLREKAEVKEIYDYCRGRIADFKIPRLIEFREEIPRSPLGKVLRNQLK